MEADCVVRGTRVVITPTGHTRIWTELHEAHPGTAMMRGLARGAVWWPSINAEVEQLVRKCKIWQINCSNPPSAPLHQWQWPKTMIKSRCIGLCRTVPRVNVLSNSGCKQTLEVD